MKLILATTQEEDIIVDPASGGYSVLKTCKTNRKFLGCDLVEILMSKISNQGRDVQKNGISGYTRVIGNELGQLLSRVQSLCNF